MPDDPQPIEGQGTPDTGSPYDSYLQAVPDEARGAAEQWFRDTSKGLDAKLQEAAELKKTWEPYQDVRGSLDAYTPESLSQLLAWHQQVTSSDEAFRDWLTTSAEEAGLTLAQKEELADAEEAGELTREQVQQLVQDAAEQRLGPVQEQLTQFESERDINVEHQAIEAAFADVRKELGRELSDDERRDVLDLGMPLAVDAKGEPLPAGDASWVKAGFDRLRGLHATGSRLFIEEKATQPGAALTTGGTPAMKPATSFADAGAQLRERLRQQS